MTKLKNELKIAKEASKKLVALLVSRNNEINRLHDEVHELHIVSQQAHAQMLKLKAKS